MLKTLCRHAITPNACISAKSFFTASTPQKFTINRILPHSQPDLFKIISDIDSYSTFVPFCISSKVTKRSSNNQEEPPSSLPTAANLKIGFKQYEETFSSLVKCSRPSKVEAVATQNPLFYRLATAWRILPIDNADKQQSSSAAQQKRQQSQVCLDIEYQFANPVYGALSGAVLPKVADQIITAFEKHAKEKLGGS